MARKPKITFTTNADDKEYPAKLESPDATAAVVEGWACPGCGGNLVAGTQRRIENHDTYAADGGCIKCRTVTGIIRVQVYDTLFGLEEDKRVMSMGVRIY